MAKLCLCWFRIQHNTTPKEANVITLLSHMRWQVRLLGATCQVQSGVLCVCYLSWPSAHHHDGTIIPFYSWGNWGTDKLSDFPEVRTGFKPRCINSKAQAPFCCCVDYCECYYEILPPSLHHSLMKTWWSTKCHPRAVREEWERESSPITEEMWIGWRMKHRQSTWLQMPALLEIGVWKPQGS